MSAAGLGRALLSFPYTQHQYTSPVKMTRHCQVACDGLRFDYGFHPRELELGAGRKTETTDLLSDGSPQPQRQHGAVRANAVRVVGRTLMTEQCRAHALMRTAPLWQRSRSQAADHGSRLSAVPYARMGQSTHSCSTPGTLGVLIMGGAHECGQCMCSVQCVRGR